MKGSALNLRELSIPGRIIARASQIELASEETGSSIARAFNPWLYSNADEVGSQVTRLPSQVRISLLTTEARANYFFFAVPTQVRSM